MCQKNFKQKIFAVKGKDMYKILLKLRDADEVKTSYAFGDYHHVTLKKEGASENDIKNYLNEQLPGEDVTVKIIQPGIEDSFMEYLNNN